jgi:uncharacterized protein (TIGR02118 family)
MIKIISLLKRNSELTFDDFKIWALQEHPKFAAKLPGLLEYRVNLLAKENPDSPYDAANELWFAGEDARQAAFGGPEGKAAVADVSAHCASRTPLIVEEFKPLSP